ncbi:MAG: phosphoribosylglycinamide formyltransferase [Gammaproteobacteria bacterium]
MTLARARGNSGEPLPIVVLISGRGSNLQSIIDRSADGRLNVTIKAVISNEPDAAGLDRAKSSGVEAIALPHRDYADRASFDRALASCIDAFAPGLVVLAGFMRLLTTEFVQRYAGRLINIHPSLLPAFQGLDTHQRALDAGEREHGVSVHFVTPELDGGPIIAQARVPVREDDDAETLGARVLEQEHELYPRVIGWFAANRLELADGVALLDGRPALDSAAAGG